MLNYDAE
jgi:uncharacterized oxidoreductase